MRLLTYPFAWAWHHRFYVGPVVASSLVYSFFTSQPDIVPADYHSLRMPLISERYRDCVALLKQASASATAAGGSPATTRRDILARMKQHSDKRTPADLLIIGGGAVGSGAALEAAARGLTVVLAERDDFASGASSKSTKLIHGGVRYLEKAFLGADLAQLKLVFEALRERSVLLSQAPHLCHELPTLVPCFSRLDLVWFWAGMKAYDALAMLGGSNLPLSRLVFPREARQWFPTLKHSAYVDALGKNKVPSESDVTRNREAERHALDTERVAERHHLCGGVLYYDGQFNDARLNVSVAMTANALGAACGNYVKVTGLLFSDEAAPTGATAEAAVGAAAATTTAAPRKVIGAVVRDELSGESFPVYSRVVLNATGAYSDAIRGLLDSGAVGSGSGDDGAATTTLPKTKGVIVPSVGTHITLPQSLTLSTTSNGGGTSPALLIPRTKDGRVLFVAPWLGRTIAGTTDRVVPPSDSSPAPTEKDVAFILDTLRPYLNVPVERAAVASAWSGVRPLAQLPDPSHPSSASGGGAATSSSSIVREHAVFAEAGVEGFVSIAGGKWTTYNKMACDAVTQAVALGGDATLREVAAQRATYPVSRYLKLVGGQKALYNLDVICAEALDKTDAWLAANSTASNGADDGKATARACKADVARHLASSYGDRAFVVLDIIRQQQQSQQSQSQQPSSQASSSGWGFGSGGGSGGSAAKNANSSIGLELLYPSLPILAAEVIYACRHEMAETPMDFLCRRSRAAFLDASGLIREHRLQQQQQQPQGGKTSTASVVRPSAISRVASIMAEEKGWDAKRRDAEIAKTVAELTREFSAQA